MFVSGALVASQAQAQNGPAIEKQMQTSMEIPGIVTMASSEAHLYVLSEREGLIVFRAGADSLHWLYSSSGLADRGQYINTDIRFAYLYGTDRRLTVIDPTSVLGVYSSTRLNTNPNDLVRMGNDLLLAFNSGGIQMLSLESSESVDQTPQRVFAHEHPVLSITTYAGEVFALDNRDMLYHFEYVDRELSLIATHSMPASSQRLFATAQRLYLTTETGGVHRIRSDGRHDELFRVDSPVSSFVRWNEHYLARTTEGQVFVARQGLAPTLLRDDRLAGNHMAVFDEQLWIAAYQDVSRWDMAGRLSEEDPLAVRRPAPRPSDGERVRITAIDDLVLPYPRALLLNLSVDSAHDLAEIRFQQRSRVEGVRIRGNSLYWQPSSQDIGTHTLSVIASNRAGQSDSTSFRVTVRPFNSPPAFSPVRPLSIAVEEPFSIPFQARDPDGTDPDLIRYIGVDLPDGAAIDERTGEFTWTPARRHSGEHRFQVIATDEYGAASSLDVRITVVDLQRTP